MINHCGCKNEELPKLFVVAQQPKQDLGEAEEDTSPAKSDKVSAKKSS